MSAPGSMTRLVLLVSVGLLAGVPLAQASDVTLEKAMKPYEKRLTTDISYLSSFSAPSKRAAPAMLTKLSRIHNDLAGATDAADSQQASTSTGRQGRSEVLSALHDASLATNDANACATAARSGKTSAAKRDAKAEQGEIDKAIPLFESGGRKLNLF